MPCPMDPMGMEVWRFNKLDGVGLFEANLHRDWGASCPVNLGSLATLRSCLYMVPTTTTTGSNIFGNDPGNASAEKMPKTWNLPFKCWKSARTFFLKTEEFNPGIARSCWFYLKENWILKVWFTYNLCPGNCYIKLVLWTMSWLRPKCRNSDAMESIPNRSNSKKMCLATKISSQSRFETTKAYPNHNFYDHLDSFTIVVFHLQHHLSMIVQLLSRPSFPFTRFQHGN